MGEPKKLSRRVRRARKNDFSVCRRGASPNLSDLPNPDCSLVMLNQLLNVGTRYPRWKFLIMLVVVMTAACTIYRFYIDTTADLVAFQKIPTSIQPHIQGFGWQLPWTIGLTDSGGPYRYNEQLFLKSDSALSASSKAKTGETARSVTSCRLGDVSLLTDRLGLTARPVHTMARVLKPSLLLTADAAHALIVCQIQPLCA